MSLHKRPLEVGDAVQLRSGGTAMTIVKMEGGMCDCVWLDRTGRDRDRSFPTEALMHDQSSTHATLIIEGYNATSEDIAAYKSELGLGNA